MDKKHDWQFAGITQPIKVQPVPLVGSVNAICRQNRNTRCEFALFAIEQGANLLDNLWAQLGAHGFDSGVAHASSITLLVSVPTLPMEISATSPAFM